jgi:pullulanase/glycogen debranching enzyme
MATVTITTGTVASKAKRQIRTIKLCELRQRRNLMATLLLSQGVPMIRGGDELGQTQWGNNNPYCQDNEISWLNWDLDAEQSEFLRFCERMTELCRTQPVLSRRNFFLGRRIRGAGVKDISWLTQDGNEIADSAWQSGLRALLACDLNGESIDEVTNAVSPSSGTHCWRCSILNMSLSSSSFLDISLQSAGSSGRIPAFPFGHTGLLT